MNKVVTNKKSIKAIMLVLLLVVCTALTGCGLFQKETEKFAVLFFTDGAGTIASQSIEAGGKVTRPDDPVNPGYTFGGWYTDPAHTVEWNFDTDTINESRVLFAKWISPSGETNSDTSTTTCVVSFYENGGSTVAPQRVNMGDKVTRPNDPVKTGYTFDGWYTDDSYTVAWNFDTDTVTKKSITIYAKWKENVPKFAVMFFTDGGGTIASQSVEAGGKVKRPADPVKTGYTFGGWYTDSTHTVAWNFDTDTVNDSISLFAKWTSSSGQTNTENSTTTCVVLFYENGGSTVSPQRVNMGGKVTRPADPVKTNYTFDGWYADESYTKAWNFDTDTVNKTSITIYAKWKQNSSGGSNEEEENQGNTGTGEDVTVTFNVGLDARKKGLSNPAAVTVKSGNKITAPAVTLAGYTLSGWYVENGSTKWNFANNVTQTMTLFAKWTGGGAQVEYTPTMTTNNTLYIHYLRSEYTNWSLWVWSTGNGKKVSYSQIDNSGAIYAIDLSQYGSATKINFKPAIINSNGDWESSDGGDVTVTLSQTKKVGGSYHWFVQEGNTAAGTNYLAAQTTADGVTTEEKRESKTNVNRSYAANLPKAATVTGCDDMGVGYQIFVASFCDSNGDGVGDLKGITSKLDYFKDLNVDVLWLTPIQSSDSYHGYDCYDYYAIDPKFGTNADYRELVYKAHQKGIKVIMDLVVNHTSTSNEWFIKSKNCVVETVTYQDGTTAQVNYRDFYRWKKSSSVSYRYCAAGDGYSYYSSFGSSMPELNYDYQPVRDAMLDVAKYWMNFGLDGFRMDAIKHMFMWEESTNASSDVKGGVGDTGYEYNLTKDVEVFKELNYKLKQKFPNAFLLGEQLSGNVDDVSPFYAGMDSLFDFNTYYDLPGRIQNGSALAAANAFNSNATKYANNRGGRAINSMITSNHDIDRLSEKLSSNVNQEKLYFAVIMTLPGLSWIYYGDEIGLIGNKSDGKGDDGLRQSMKWTSSWANKCTAIYDYKINNSTKSVAEQESDNNSLLNYVKKLTKLRNDYPALISGNATCSTQDGMLKITVTGGGQTLTVYHNFSNSTKTVSGTPVFGTSAVTPYGTSVVI
ncbi:MAG: hypothetical protein HDT28_00675 [Clostridiales bacterium]|nr:hypothetical protein [Clostridiales bacterium]